MSNRFSRKNNKKYFKMSSAEDLTQSAKHYHIKMGSLKAKELLEYKNSILVCPGNKCLNLEFKQTQFHGSVCACGLGWEMKRLLVRSNKQEGQLIYLYIAHLGCTISWY